MDKVKSLRGKQGLSGVPSGFKAVDKETGGWQPSDLIIIAARPAMGKTAFILSMARNIAVDQNIPLALFSLEMASVQLIMRMISSETGISSEKLRKGTLTDEEWERLLVTFPIWRRLLFISMKHPLFRYSTLERNAVDWLCSMVYGLSWSTTFS